jgi:hypothetical protein
VTARATYGETLWLLGYPDQAMRAIATAVADARAIDHANTLCNTLRKACPVALFCGDDTALETFTSMLLAQAAKYGLAAWHAQARCYTGLLLLARGDVSGGLEILRATLAGEHGNSMRSNYLRGVLAETLGRAGETALARTTIDAALAQAERNHEGWCIPELLRIKGDLLLDGGAGDAAEECLLRSYELACAQQALSWELRTAMSLARLRRGQHRIVEARALLGAVYERFSEGFASADLRRARSLLDALA